MIVMRVITLLLTSVCFLKLFGFSNSQNNGTILKKSNVTTAETKIEEKKIMQPLDHFNKTNWHTWSMRYFKSLEFWKPGGPIYLFINGETKANTAFLQTGIMYELAKETNGAMYLSEHRYYGESKPYDKYDTKTLAYLSSQQALADNAKLLKSIKSNAQYKKSKVVVVGGSYAGNLATWMKLRYSDRVDAAIASSAPVLVKADFCEYLDVVAIDYKNYGTTGCYEKIETKFKRYDRLFQTNAGIQQLKKEYDICDSTDLNQTDSKAIFFLYRVNPIYSEVAQYGTPQKIKKSCGNDNSRVKHSHKSLCHKSKIPSERTLWMVAMTCYQYTLDAYVKSIRDSSDSMAWTYQTCTEFGYYQTSNSDNQPFTKNMPIQFFYNMCSALYGVDFDSKRVQEGVKKSNDMYGGLHPNVTQVVFVNGDMDPWHKLGILHDLSKDAPAFLIHGTSHTADLQSNQAGESEVLKDTRKKVKNLIKKWIGAGRIDG